MKKCPFLLVLCCLLGAAGLRVDAQSRRDSPRSNEKKANTRPADEPKPAPTQTPAADAGAEDSGEVISVDTRLVTIPVRILDRKNRFIGGLAKENFTIFEDNVPQDVAYFTNEAQPFTVALVLDMSYSSTFKIEDIQNAAIAFVAQLRPDDRVIVISFDEEIHILSGETSDRDKLTRAIRATKIGTGTSLYEAVDAVINTQLRPIKGRKAVVLFTDGVDTTSRAANDTDNLRDAQELDALIYPIRYDTFADVQEMKNAPPTLGLPGGGIKMPKGIRLPDSQSRRRPDPTIDAGREPDSFPQSRPMPTAGEKGTTPEEYRFAAEYLDQLAERTGGRVAVASSYGNLNAAFARIASELREFYSIGYYPKADAEPGTMRRIKVKVDRENVAVRARDGYVVPEKKQSQ